MNGTKSVLLVGVGGQGTILASKILSEGLMRIGYDVKMSEIHGMSQRGGSVTTHVRFGESVASPIVPKGEADVLVAFEASEAVRYLPYLKRGGTMVVNDFEIHPMSVFIGASAYPENITAELKKAVGNVKCFNAGEIAQSVGNIKAQNIVLLGALIKSFGLENAADWNMILEEFIPAKLLDINKKAFAAGLAQ